MLSETTKETLKSAAFELRRLRAENQAMREKLALVEGLLELRHLRGPDMHATPDVAWQLERLIHEAGTK